MSHEGESPQESIARAREGASGGRRCRCPYCGYTVNLRTWWLEWGCPTLRCPGTTVPDED